MGHETFQLVTNVLAITGGLMAVTYHEIAVAKFWPEGEIFHDHLLAITVVGAATFLEGIASQFIFGSFLTGVLALLASFVGSMFLTSVLRSWTQLASLTLLILAWSFLLWPLILWALR